MKVAYKDCTGKWKTVNKVRNININRVHIILTKFDGSVEAIKTDQVKYLRQTKLYEED